MSAEFVGRFRVVVVVIDSDDQDRTPTPSRPIARGEDRAVIELTVRLTDEQLAEIAQRAAVLVAADAPVVEGRTG